MFDKITVRLIDWLNLYDLFIFAGFLFREQSRNKIFDFSHDRHLRITLINYTIFLKKSMGIYHI